MKIQVGWCVQILKDDEWLLFELTHLKEKAQSLLFSLADHMNTKHIRAVKMYIEEEEK